jgi:hypothetical protein
MEQALGYEVTPPELRARAAAEKMKQRKQHTKYVSPEGISGTATDHAVRLGISRYRAEKLANGWCSNLNALYRALGLND